MRLLSAASYLRAAWRLRSYKPKKVTLISLIRWARQFPRDCRPDLIRLVANLRFVSERETIRHLVELNSEILCALRKDGIDIQNVIYVSTGSAGSSSSVMLNLLRDHANLERRGAIFLHYGEGMEIQRRTIKLGSGAIVYVDDFSGTGKQFIRSRKNVAEFVVGPFSEFFLLPCICEEAQSKIEAAGIKPQIAFVHTKSERPLLGDCNFLRRRQRERLVTLSHEIWGRENALGFDRLATNVVFYRNSPNTTPLILRGNLGQRHHFGVVPRYDDL